MEQITLLYTLFVLFSSVILSSCLLRDRRTWIFGLFFLIVFLDFAWLTHTEILDHSLKNDPLRAHVFRGIFSIGILMVLAYRMWKRWGYKWQKLPNIFRSTK